MDLATYAVLNKKIDTIGNIPDEKITEAVNTYLDKNPPTTGATAEQAAQINKNVADIGELKGDLETIKSVSGIITLNPNDYEGGTAYLSNDGKTLIKEENEKIFCHKKNVSQFIPKGYSITSDTLSFRIIHQEDDGTYTYPTGDKNYVNDFTTTYDGNYILVFGYRDQRTITDDEIINGIKTVVIIPLSVNQKQDNVYLYNDSTLYESGTLYINSGRVTYENVSGFNVIRTKQYSNFQFNAGDRIVQNGYKTKIRLVKINNATETSKYYTGTEIQSYTTDDIVISENGYYAIAIATIDGAAILDIPALLRDNIKILNSENAVYKEYIQSLEDIVYAQPDDNHARSVFAVMTYNVGGWYNGSGTNVPEADYERFLELQRNILDRYNPDILCIQEYKDYISQNKPSAENFLNKRYKYSINKYGDTTYDGKAICTNMSLVDASNVAFEATDGCLRNYEKAYIYCNGKKICVISAHLALSESVVAQNSAELLAAIASENYFIICLDANADASDPNSTRYIGALKPFLDAGYKLANDGSCITFPSESLALDNVIVSPNIGIKSVVVDMQKEGLSEGSDHYPLIAYLEIF